MRALSKRGVLFSAPIAAVLLFTVPFPRAEAQGAVEAPSQSDPVLVNARKLWDRIKTRCAAAPDQGLHIGIVGFELDDTSIHDRVKDQLNIWLAAAFNDFIQADATSTVMNMRSRAELGVGGRPDDDRYRTGDAAKRRDQTINLRIHAGGVPYGRGYSLNLKAVGTNGLACNEYIDKFDVPKDQFIEPIVTEDQLLLRAAIHVLKQSRGEQQQKIWLRSSLPDLSPAPDIWNEAMARAFGRSVDKARDIVQLLERTNVAVEPTVNYSEPKDWRSRLVIDPNLPEGARIEVEVQPPEGSSGGATNFDGLINRDRLPPLPTKSTKELPLSTESARRFEVGFTTGERRREFLFSLPRSIALEVDLEEPGSEVPPAVGVLDTRGTIVAPAEEGGGRKHPLRRRWRLPEGHYSLWFESRSPLAARFVARVRASFDSLEKEFDFLGETRAKSDDWWNVLVEEGGQKKCLAFTSAKEISPSNLRIERPFLAFRMGYGKDEIEQHTDSISSWRHPAMVEVSLVTKRSREPVNKVIVKDDIRIVEPCEENPTESCINANMLVRLNQSSQLTIEGLAMDGSRGRVVYSLKGYKKAVAMMANDCNQPKIADKLVMDKPPKEGRKKAVQ